MTAFTCGLGVFTSSLCFLKIIMKWDNLAFYLGINYWNANINGSSKWGKNMADIYVTADMKYNDFMTPDKALTVADIGHFESEYCAIQILFDILSKNLITFAVRKSEDSRNPVNYLV